MNYFEYNGIRSSDMGVRISSKDIFSAPKYDLAFHAIPGRDGELISPNNRFPNVTVSYTCFIPAKSIQELSEKVTVVKAWLYTEPDRYHTLSDSYDTAHFRKAVFNNKLDIADQLNKIGTFTVNFSCHPMRFSYTGQTTQTFTASGFVLTNPYPVKAKPYIKIYGAGKATLTVQTPSTNESWTFSALDSYTECDSELMNFYKGTKSKNDKVTGSGFPCLYPGKNTISYTGGVTKIEIIPRWVTL